MAGTGGQKKRGRPSTGKRGTFTFRVTEGLRNRLTAESESLQRPVSEVIEQRLEQSYAEEDFARRTAFNVENVALAGQVMKCATLAEAFTGRSWKEDEFTRDALIAAISQLIHPLSEETLKRNMIADMLRNWDKDPDARSPTSVGKMIASSVSTQRMGGLLGVASPEER